MAAMAGECPPPLLTPSESRLLPPSAQSVAPPSVPNLQPRPSSPRPLSRRCLARSVGSSRWPARSLGIRNGTCPARSVWCCTHQARSVGSRRCPAKSMGELPKKSCKKKSSEACGELQRSSDVRGVRNATSDSCVEQRDGNKVLTSLPLSMKSAKKL